MIHIKAGKLKLVCKTMEKEVSKTQIKVDNFIKKKKPITLKLWMGMGHGKSAPCSGLPWFRQFF